MSSLLRIIDLGNLGMLTSDPALTPGHRRPSRPTVRPEGQAGQASGRHGCGLDGVAAHCEVEPWTGAPAARPRRIAGLRDVSVSLAGLRADFNLPDGSRPQRAAQPA